MRPGTLQKIQTALDRVGCGLPVADRIEATLRVQTALDALNCQGILCAWMIVDTDDPDPDLIRADVQESSVPKFVRISIRVNVDPDMRAVWEVMES